jgi:hypothetical protein
VKKVLESKYGYGEGRWLWRVKMVMDKDDVYGE